MKKQTKIILQELVNVANERVFKVKKLINITEPPIDSRLNERDVKILLSHSTVEIVRK